jgi:cellobiose transport system permease protein
MTRKSLFVRLLMVGFVAVVSLVAIYPYYSMIMMGTYYSNDLFTGIKVLPGNYLKENFATLKTINILLFYKNSIIVSVSSAVLTVLVCAAAGFGFAKYQFRFKKPLFTFILLTMMIPLQLGIVAFLVEMRAIGWLKTLLPLIVPPAANAFGAFWMTQFAVQAIPDEVMESARIDGCSEFRIFLQIALPFMVPACTTLGLLSFLWSWNSLFQPLIVISDAKLFTIPLGIRQLATNFRQDNAAQILGLTLTSIPILFFFALFSRSLISGLSSAAVKG